MRILATIFFLIAFSIGFGQAGNFSFTISNPTTASAGVFRKDGSLVRLLWTPKFYNPGTYTSFWDGRDDLNRLIVKPDSSYVIKIKTFTAKFAWMGVIGNTSDSLTGSTVIRSYYHNARGIAFAGRFAYWAGGYSETFPSLFKTDTGRMQQKINISTGTHTGNIDYVCTDGKVVYWGVSDVGDARNNTFVIGTNCTDDKETQFTNGSLYTIVNGSKYTKAIARLNILNSGITGMAVQKTDSFLFVANGGLNQIQVINKRTGQLIRKETLTNPRGLCVDNSNNLWVVTAGKVSRYSISAAGSFLPLNSITIDALATQVVNNTLIIADGSTSQLKGFDNAAGTLLWSYGQPGGYLNNATVTNDKFFWKDNIETRLVFIAAQGSTFWVSDPFNYRVQQYDANRKFIKRVQSLGSSYVVFPDKNRIENIYSGPLQFSYNYTPLPNLNAWSLKNNWGATIGGLQLKFPTTLANGRTYALLRTGADNHEVIELTAEGTVRRTGCILTKSILCQDGSIERYEVAGLGDTTIISKYSLCGFSTDNNPMWYKVPEVIARTPALTLNDPNASPKNEVLTKSNKVIFYNYNIVQDYRLPGDADDILYTGFHLGAIPRGSSAWQWMTELATHATYSGAYPEIGRFDIGNNVNQYAGGTVSIVDNYIITSYHGEFWKNGQTNKYNVYFDDGLPVGQFGTTRPETVGVAAAGMAGNALTPTAVKDSLGNFYLWHGDESDHGGLHCWKIIITDVKEILVPINYPSLYKPAATTAVNLMAGLPFNQQLRNGNGWTRYPLTDTIKDNYTDSWNVNTSRLTYDRFGNTDLQIGFVNKSAKAYYVQRDLGSVNAVTNWTISGELSYQNNNPNGINITQQLQVIDSAGKIIAKFYLTIARTSSPFTIKVFGNGVQIASGAELAMKAVTWKYQPIKIVGTATGIQFTYANYPPITVAGFPKGSNWRRPKYLRVDFRSTSTTATVYGSNINAKNLILIKN